METQVIKAPSLMLGMTPVSPKVQGSGSAKILAPIAGQRMTITLSK